VLPMLVLRLHGLSLGESRYVHGLLFFMCWRIAESFNAVRRLTREIESRYLIYIQVHPRGSEAHLSSWTNTPFQLEGKGAEST